VLESADLVVVITDHADVDYARVAARAQRIFDTRNAMRDVRVGREKIHKL
jgi:UDP-N-acetyl-D-glucosamine dehydrogenase